MLNVNVFFVPRVHVSINVNVKDLFSAYVRVAEVLFDAGSLFEILKSSYRKLYVISILKVI